MTHATERLGTIPDLLIFYLNEGIANKDRMFFLTIPLCKISRKYKN